MKASKPTNFTFLTWSFSISQMGFMISTSTLDTSAFKTFKQVLQFRKDIHCSGRNILTHTVHFGNCRKEEGTEEEETQPSETWDNYLNTETWLICSAGWNTETETLRHWDTETWSLQFSYQSSDWFSSSHLLVTVCQGWDRQPELITF